MLVANQDRMAQTYATCKVLTQGLRPSVQGAAATVCSLHMVQAIQKGTEIAAVAGNFCTDLLRFAILALFQLLLLCGLTWNSIKTLERYLCNQVSGFVNFGCVFLAIHLCHQTTNPTVPY